MQIDPMVVSIASAVIALCALLLNRNKDQRQSAADYARMDAQLGSIMSGVDDIRVELRSMRSQLDRHTERIATCEAKIKNLEKEVFRNNDKLESQT